MAGTADLIDAGIKYADNISPTDADNSKRRTRCLHYLQMVVEEIWHSEEWQFAHVRLAANVTTTSLAIPTDYADLTKDCALFWTNKQKEIIERSIQEIQAIRQLGQDPDPPSFFAVQGDKFEFAAAPSATVPIIQVYKKMVGTLTDANPGGLTDIPARWHWNVVYPGLVAKLQASKGDARDWEKQYTMGLAKMAAGEIKRKTVVLQMPMEVPGMW